MSSILKALKKLEHERSERSLDLLKIDTDILKTTDARSFSPFAMALLLLLVFGGGVAVAYYFMKSSTVPLATTTKAQPAITAENQLPPVTHLMSKPDSLPPEIIVVPARKEPTGEKIPQRHLKKPATTAKETNPDTAKTTDLNISKKSSEMDTAEKKGFLAAARAPTLRVNGIAFQNGTADSMAIVNGVPVSSGSIIEGATVEEIQRDRVLFQCNGEKFEIRLGQSNR